MRRWQGSMLPNICAFTVCLRRRRNAPPALSPSSRRGVPCSPTAVYVHMLTLWGIRCMLWTSVAITELRWYCPMGLRWPLAFWLLPPIVPVLPSIRPIGHRGSCPIWPTCRPQHCLSRQAWLPLPALWRRHVASHARNAPFTNGRGRTFHSGRRGACGLHTWEWSMGVLFRELAALYEAFSTGKPSPPPECPSSMQTSHSGNGNGCRGRFSKRSCPIGQSSLLATFPCCNCPLSVRGRQTRRSTS